MIVLINSKRLTSSFKFDPTVYKGIRVGDLLRIPEEHSENLFTNLVKVIGFNPEHDIIHWKSFGRYGGVCHSGSFYSEVMVVGS